MELQPIFSLFRTPILPSLIRIGKAGMRGRSRRRGLLRGRTLVFSCSLYLCVLGPTTIHSFLPCANRSVVACSDEQITCDGVSNCSKANSKVPTHLRECHSPNCSMMVRKLIRKLRDLNDSPWVLFVLP